MPYSLKNRKTMVGSRETVGILSLLPSARRALFCLLALCFAIFFISYAEAGQEIAKFSLVKGRVDVLGGGKLPASPAKVGAPLFVKDVVRVKSKSKAEVIFIDGNVIKIGQRSRIDISEYISEGGKKVGILKLPRGKVEAIVNFVGKTVKNISGIEGANRFEIHTPNAVAGVRGTHFFVFHQGDNTTIYVKDGNVYVYNPQFSDKVTNVTAGQIIMVPAQSEPLPPKPATDAEIKGLEEGLVSGETTIYNESVRGGAGGPVDVLATATEQPATDSVAAITSQTPSINVPEPPPITETVAVPAATTATPLPLPPNMPPTGVPAAVVTPPPLPTPGSTPNPISGPPPPP